MWEEENKKKNDEKDNVELNVVVSTIELSVWLLHKNKFICMKKITFYVAK